MLRGTPLALAGLLTVIAGCSEGIAPGPRFPACPRFDVATTTIGLTAERDSIPLGDVTLLVPAGAVTEPAEVEVARGILQRNAASVRFARVGGGTVSFGVPVTLRISYANCPAADFIQPAVYRVDLSRPERRESVNREGPRYVDAPLNSLSEYALAFD